MMNDLTLTTYENNEQAEPLYEIYKLTLHHIIIDEKGNVHQAKNPESIRSSFVQTIGDDRATNITKFELYKLFDRLLNEALDRMEERENEPARKETGK